MKKFLIAILFLLLPVLTNASTIPEGAIIKTADNPDVYIVKYNNGKQFRRLILNPQVFESYGHLKWENIITITAAEMNSCKISNLVKVENDPKVLALAPNGDAGSKSWLNVAAIDFIAVGGDWDSVYQINAVDASNYNIATDLTTRSQVQTFLISNILPNIVPTPSSVPVITPTITPSPTPTISPPPPPLVVPKVLGTNADYINFKSMFTIIKIRTTENDEILYDTQYNGVLNQEEFWIYFSSIDTDLKITLAKQLATEVRDSNARYTIALDFKYSTTKLGYAFAYPPNGYYADGYSLASFTKNPFLIF